MKKKLTFITCILIANFAFSEESYGLESRMEQLSQAYGFILGQQGSLELIEKEFPELTSDVRASWLAFNSTALGDSVNGIEKELSMKLGNNWPEFKKRTTTNINTTVRSQSFNKRQASAFLQEVNQRAEGKIPELILATLLSANTKFSEKPVLELTNGWVQTFRSAGHPKAKGIDFSISLPASWIKREGHRPNIVQFFTSGAGHGPIKCSLMVKDLPLPDGYNFSEEKLKEFFQPHEMKKTFSDAGTIIDAKSITLEGIPAGMLVIDHEVQRLDITLNLRMTQIILIQGNAMIFVQFVVSEKSESKESVDELHEKFLPTYRAIANTFILNDKYK